MISNLKNFENNDVGRNEKKVVYVGEHEIQRGASSLMVSYD
jgi:hypothetical protein